MSDARMGVNEVPELFFAALCVWADYYGIGQDRISRLAADGYDPDHVQTIVNMLGAVFDKCRELEP